ncbi:Cyclic nucleotide-binding domain-containing protein [Verrucomicrobium sp. GAS474]|uniref:cyclic nucleotide-binding domain-containing protein n=1 Tax=Verrucomicrobium sp. GAS474 TaxID=1882831 RepID=UPI00087CB5E0|nr:cyclic nucleotide-binding domain-containing protein [Verrucomicrobium sp. GAS474]SDT96646.1 Cyclic nucleotide-binding domain-containing protein [Verrucomicrobium sp. GAS474]
MKETPVLESPSSIIETLKQVSFFPSLEDHQIIEIFRQSRVRNFDAGETVIPEGAYDTFIYILLTGMVEVLKQGHLLASLTRTGDIFGELAILNCESRSASVVTLSKTSCLAIDATFLENLPPSDRDPVYAIVYRTFAEMVSHRLRTTSDALAETRMEVARLRDDLAKR